MLRFARALALSLFTLAGCGPQTYVIQSYDGPVRARETIAILRINSDDAIQVVTVDGEYADPQLAPDSRLHIELVPGKHEVGASTGVVTQYGEQSRLLRRLSFRAEPGRVYRVAFAGGASQGGPDGEPRVFEVDRSSDSALRDVTVSLPEPRELPAPAATPAQVPIAQDPATQVPAAPEAPAPEPSVPATSATPAPAAPSTPATPSSAPASPEPPAAPPSEAPAPDPSIPPMP